MLWKMRSNRRQPTPWWEGGTQVTHLPTQVGKREGSGPWEARGTLKHRVQGEDGDRNWNWAKGQLLGPGPVDKGEQDQWGGTTLKKHVWLNPQEENELVEGQASRNAQGKMLVVG